MIAGLEFWVVEDPVEGCWRRGGRLCSADLRSAFPGQHGDRRGRAVSAAARWRRASSRPGWLHAGQATGRYHAREPTRTP